MRTVRNSSPVFLIFQRARKHYSRLGISEENDAEFLSSFLGCSKSLKKKWESSGIRKIYRCIVDLLDENMKLIDINVKLNESLNEQIEGRRRLEEQLKELLKK